MTQPTFDFSTLFDTYKTAMAPVFRAQQEGLKTFERLARYQFAVAGDYLEWSLEQAKASVGPKSAADLIGQLGDPLYPRKANALFYEFEELGSNRQFGYSSPADLVEKFPAFYWNTVSGHLEEGMKYLSLTASGRQWIANLHNHIFNAEHFNWQMGPQI